MNPKLTETITVDFITSSPTTGAAIDADSLPTCEVFEDTTDVAILAPTVTKRSAKTGNYRVAVAVTTANGFEAGKSYNVIVAATVGTVAAKAVVQTFQVRTNSEDDLATQASVTTLSGYVDTEVAAILAAVDTEVASILAKVNALPADPADASDIAAAFSTVNLKLDAIDDFVDTEIQAIKTKTDNLPVDPASASSMASSFTVVNSKLDVVDDYLDTEVAAIKAKTDQLTFTGGKVDANASLALVAADLTAIADAILKRDWTAVSGEAAYSLLQAARMLRNVWSTTGGVLVVKKEDGSTNAWSRPLSVDPAAQPITGAS